MNVTWLSIAEEDLALALDYYLNTEESPTAASALVEEVDTAVAAISTSPLTFPRSDGDVEIW